MDGVKRGVGIGDRGSTVVHELVLKTHVKRSVRRRGKRLPDLARDILGTAVVVPEGVFDLRVFGGWLASRK